MSINELQNYYKKFLIKESLDDAISEAQEEGHSDFESEESAGMKRANKILETIKRKDSYKDQMEDKLEKGAYPPPDYGAIGTAICQKQGHSDFSEGSSGAACRDYHARGMQSEKGRGGGPLNEWDQAGGHKVENSMDIEKQLSPALASLMSAAAGWAFSDSLKPGEMSPEQAREWERTLSAADRRKMERSLRSKMRKNSVDKTLDKSSFDALKEHYTDASDEYIKRSPEKNDFLVSKDHSLLPPRQGLMWDAVKHRWTRPENVGHTVTEVQGKKRFRGVGTGAHERSVGGHGHGKVREAEKGRRFKGQADMGAIRPHESKRPAGHPKHKKA